jgi:hypothetical protein
MKKISFVFVLMVLSIFPNLVFSMKISEIMYDTPGTDSGREWIEVFNDSSETIDLSNWKFLENAVNHSLKLILGDSKISSGEYAVIADNDQNFLTDNPGFKGTLFDSAFSLTNTGENLAIIDPTGKTIDQVGYSDSLGAKGDRNSLQLYEGVFISSFATPGLSNTKQNNSSSVSQISTTTTSSVSAHSSTQDLSKIKPEIDFEINIGKERAVSIKTPIKFEPYTDDRFKRNSIKFLWNFGDGNESKSKKPEHHYKHSGIYNVVLNASQNGQNAVSRTLVSVFKPTIEFKIIPEGLEFYNNSKNEINIGGWKVKSEDKTINFTFPRDTIVSANNKIIFDRDLFVEKDKNIDFLQIKINLYFPNGDIINP